MRTTKNSIAVHIAVLSVVTLFSVIIIMTYLTYQKDESVLMVIFTVLSTISVGYFRPFLSRWIRWFVLVLVLLICIGVCDEDIWLSWCTVLMCILSLTIVARRFVMEKMGDNRIAERSAMRELYNGLDESYKDIATRLDNLLHGANAVEMVPVAHAVAIMTFSLLCLFLCTYESGPIKMEDTGYYIYLALILAIPFLYALWNSKCFKDSLLYLLSAIVMTISGIVAVVVCVFIAVLAIIFISAVFTAISNLLHKLFGKE